MRVYSGKSVFGGIAIGTIQVYKKGEQQVKRRKIEDVPAEIRRYRTAKQTALEQLQNLYDKALKEVGEANAAIFEIHQMMLEDDDYNESVENIIETQRVNAEYAVAVTEDNFAQMFASMEDEYMRGRAADVRDISERLVSVLSGNAGGGVQTEEPVIIAAQDLAPSETVQMDKQKVLSFVTIDGSMNYSILPLSSTPSHDWKYSDVLSFKTAEKLISTVPVSRSSTLESLHETFRSAFDHGRYFWVNCPVNCVSQMSAILLNCGVSN